MPTCLIIFASLLILLPSGDDDRKSTDIEGNIQQQGSAIAWTASWSYNDRFIAIGNDRGELTIYETTSWKKVKSWQYNATTITRVEWSPTYPVLAVASVSYAGSPSVIQLYDVEKDSVIKKLPDSLRGRGVTWNPAGDQVAFVGSKGRISLFSKEGKLNNTLAFTHPNSVMDIDWHPTKDLLLIVEEDIYIFDIGADRLLATYDDGSKNKGILCCQWHPSGRFFVTGDYGHENEGGEPSYVKYWDSRGKMLSRIRESKFEYRNLRWRKDGKYLAATGDALLISDAKGRLIAKTKFDDNNLWGVEWSNKGDRIISTDQVGNIRITDVKGKILKSFKL